MPTIRRRRCGRHEQSPRGPSHGGPAGPSEQPTLKGSHPAALANISSCTEDVSPRVPLWIGFVASMSLLAFFLVVAWPLLDWSLDRPESSRAAVVVYAVVERRRPVRRLQCAGDLGDVDHRRQGALGLGLASDTSCLGAARASSSEEDTAVQNEQPSPVQGPPLLEKVV
uniref:Uncharacterized protein n=1 Tax=Odontella aurita TaxID=265563 RepID=A0A7S4J6D9_9STRA